MNPGKRLLRNTVFALWGAAALFVGLNRLHSASAGLPTLGLRVEREPEPMPEVDLAKVRDFTKLSVHGRFTVEVIGGQDYSVVFTPAAGDSTKIRAWLRDGTLHVNGADDAGNEAEGALRIALPTLERIDLAATQLVVRGLTGPELSLVSFRGGVVRLLDSQVASWKVFSGSPLEVRVDDATFGAGQIKASGDVVVRRD